MDVMIGRVDGIRTRKLGPFPVPPAMATWYREIVIQRGGEQLRLQFLAETEDALIIAEKLAGPLSG